MIIAPRKTIDISPLKEATRFAWTRTRRVNDFEVALQWRKDGDRVPDTTNFALLDQRS